MLTRVTDPADTDEARLGGDLVEARSGTTMMQRTATAMAIENATSATLMSANGTVFVGLVVAGLGGSVMFPQLYGRAARAPNPGAALGALTAGIRISLLGFPALVGALADADAFTVGEAIAVVVIPASIAVVLLTARSDRSPV